MSSIDTSKLVKPTLVELKAGAWDRISQIEALQKELNYINQEIEKQSNQLKAVDSSKQVEDVKKEEVKEEKKPEMLNKDLGVKK